MTRATFGATAFRFTDGALWIATPEAVRRLDLATGEVARVPFELGLSRARSIAVSPDEKAVLVVDEGRCVLLFDPLGDAEEPVELFVEGIADVAWCPTGARIALAHAEEGLLVVDSHTLEPVWGAEFIASQRPELRFATDGSLVGVNTCEAVVIYEAEEGELKARIERAEEPLFAWSADATLRKLRLSVDCGARIYDLELAGDEFEIPEPESHVCHTIDDGRITALGPGPSGKALEASTSGTVGLRTPLGVREVGRIEPDGDSTPEPLRTSVSPDGRFAVTLSVNGTLTIHRIAVGLPNAPRFTFGMPG